MTHVTVLRNNLTELGLVLIIMAPETTKPVICILMAKMLAGLEAADGSLGLQVMCIGHGMSTATIVERL